jgi:hypothetical protein
VAGDDDDIVSICSRQGVGAVIGSISASLIHGVRLYGAIDYAARAILKLRMDVDGRDIHF